MEKSPKKPSTQDDSCGSDEENADSQPSVSLNGCAGTEETESMDVILLKLDDNLKKKLTQDLSSICDVSIEEAVKMLEKHNWDIQSAIDAFLENSETSDGDVVHDDKLQNSSHSDTAVASSSSSKQPVEIENLTRIAPEQFTIMSWNLDHLDSNNLEKRIEAVLDVVEREKHGVIFFQELLPRTFDYIARKLLSNYRPIVGTDNPDCEYLTATFLRKYVVHFEDCKIIPYENTCMGRNLLVTKAIIGNVKLALLNTHLESTANFSQQRQEQLKICFDYVRKLSREYDVILGGDLNLRDKEVPDNDFADVWSFCGSRHSAKYTWDLSKNTNKQMPCLYQPKLRFDRFYFKPSSKRPGQLMPKFFVLTGIKKVPGTQSFPSDHWAIVAFFALSEDARMPTEKTNSGKDGPQTPRTVASSWLRGP